MKIRSDGSTAAYYELPQDATELQHLIAHKNMNAQIGEIFRACYRYGEVEHSEMLRDAKKILFYAKAEIERLENISRTDTAKPEFNSDMAVINIVSYEEQPDGSAIAHLDMDGEAQRLLIEEGFVSLIKKYMADEQTHREPLETQTGT